MHTAVPASTLGCIARSLSLQSNHCTLVVLLFLLLPADPLSGQPLSSDALVPNLVLRDMIHAWLQEDPASNSNASSDSSSGDGQCADSSAVPAAVSRSSSPSKDRKVVAGSDRDAVKDAMLPSTPVRTSRDV